MAWRNYKVVMQLRSPMHIGWGKAGNLQRTRPYVTGRVLWGALTMRLTRDAANGNMPASDSREYQKFGEQVHQSLAFTYFFPALRSENTYQVVWPWENESAFRYRFLSSYAGTAISNSQQSAAARLLRETEFISPRTIDNGEPVFLIGYIFEKETCTLPWKSALQRLQLGGERGYGFGGIGDVLVCKSENGNLFINEIKFHDGGDRPSVSVLASDGFQPRLLAHALTTKLTAAGEIEPLVGREWRSNQVCARYAGQHIEFNDVCFAPGSVLSEPTDFVIDKFGLWRRLDNFD